MTRLPEVLKSRLKSKPLLTMVEIPEMLEPYKFL